MKNINTLFHVPIAMFLAMLWLTAGSLTPAYAQDVQAELRPETFSIDEAATLQITIENAQAADITMPEIDGLLFHSRGRSSQIQIINGAVAASVVYTYLVEPVKAGSYEIPPIRVDHQNKTLHTKPLACTVTQSSASKNLQQTAPTETPAANASQAFISFIPEKDTIYRGEVVPATIKAYFKRGTRVNQLTLPRMIGEGLLIDELSNNPPQVQEVVDNVAYSVLVWDTFITGVKEGRHETSFELDATVLVPSRKRTPLPGFGSGIFNDDFFGDMFSSYSSKSVQATSDTTAVEVIPLPESSKPEGFSGAIGRFSMTLDAQPTDIDPGNR